MSVPELSFISYDRFVADVQTLAAALAEDCWRPAYVVGIGRGGLVPATFLSHRTGIPLLTVDYSAGLPAFAQDHIGRLADLTRTGIALLLVDDINDSGATIAMLRRLLVDHAAAINHVRIAVLIDNIRSSEQVDYRGRTIDRQQDKRWFVFPWEAIAPRDTLVDEAGAVPDRLA